MQFTHETEIAGRTVTVEAETVPELWQAIAGLEELNRDARYLYKRLGNEDGKKPKICFVYRKDNEENEYYGFAEVRSDGNPPRNVTLGQKRDKEAVVPFFPKGEEGYYNPSQGGRGQRQAPQRQRPPREDTNQDPRQNAAAKKDGDNLPF